MWMKCQLISIVYLYDCIIKLTDLSLRRSFIIWLFSFHNYAVVPTESKMATRSVSPTSIYYIPDESAFSKRPSIDVNVKYVP